MNHFSVNSPNRNHAGRFVRLNAQAKPSSTPDRFGYLALAATLLFPLRRKEIRAVLESTCRGEVD